MRHDEAEVGADEAVLGVGSCGDGVLQRHAALAVGQLLGGLAAGLDDARQLALVLGGEQGDLADVVQVQADGVVHCVVVNRSFAVFIPTCRCRRHSRCSTASSGGVGVRAGSTPAGESGKHQDNKVVKRPSRRGPPMSALRGWSRPEPYTRAVPSPGSPAGPTAGGDVVRRRESACSAARSTRPTSATWSRPSTSATPSTSTR